jgi:hypothetical protein
MHFLVSKMFYVRNGKKEHNIFSSFHTKFAEQVLNNEAKIFLPKNFLINPLSLDDKIWTNLNES